MARTASCCRTATLAVCLGLNDSAPWTSSWCGPSSASSSSLGLSPAFQITPTSNKGHNARQVFKRRLLFSSLICWCCSCSSSMHLIGEPSIARRMPTRAAADNTDLPAAAACWPCTLPRTCRASRRTGRSPSAASSLLSPYSTLRCNAARRLPFRARVHTYMRACVRALITFHGGDDPL